MSTQYYTACSLDGFIAAPGDSLDWLFSLGDPVDTSYPTFIKDVGALAMGSSTYEWMLRHVIGPEADHPEPWPYRQPTWVFTTRTLPGIPGADVRFARGDVRPVHAAMVEAAAGRNVWLVGGGDLVGQFHDHGLLDEIILGIAPVLLSRGAPLLPRHLSARELILTGTAQVGRFAYLTYAVGTTPLPDRHPGVAARREEPARR